MSFLSAIEENADNLANLKAELEKALLACDDLARGQADLLEIILACRKLGDALPEGLRLQIDALFSTATLVQPPPPATTPDDGPDPLG